MKNIAIKPKNSVKKAFVVFVVLWFLIIGALFTIVYATGFEPDYVRQFANDAISAAVSSDVSRVQIFASSTSFISIPEISLVSPIVYPTSTDFNVLDKALLSGVVHYPKSALPGEDGTVFIFGHSTSKLVVRNKAFTAFTKIHDLTVGDIIYIMFQNVEYRYRVSAVKNNVDPKMESVTFASDGPKLILTTCWPPGNIKNRTVVEAEYLGTNAAK